MKNIQLAILLAFVGSIYTLNSQEWASVNELIPPENLNYAVMDDNDVNLYWSQPPSGESTYLHWDSGENSDSFGFFLSAEQFSCAAKWNPEHITDYDGWVITSLRFYVTSSSPTIQLKLWTGPDAVEVYSQDVEDFNVDEWTEVYLDTPFEIDASTELLAGIYIDMPFTGPVMGTDDGPGITGQGDLMYWNGDWWDGPSMGIDANWNIQIQVEAPSAPVSLHWDSGENSDSFGFFLSAEQFSCAAKWNPEHITDYDGWEITSLRFYVTSSSPTIQLKLWTGSDATEVYSQEVDAFNVDEWTEIVLDTPFEIDASTELLAGIDIDMPFTGPIMGIDEGPAIEGYGDLMYWNNQWWDGASMGVSANWNIQIEISNPSANNKKSVLGYNVYRDDVVLNENPVSATAYVDENLSNGIYEYYVTALYDEGESGPSNIVEVTINQPVIVSSDSLALVDIYNNCNGTGWYNQDNWLTGPVNEWNGVTTTGTRVTGLWLSFQYLTGDIPESIGNLTALESLHLENNDIESIPESFGDLESLKECWLGWTLITDIPESIGNLLLLEQLHIGFLDLGTLPDSFGNMESLKWLALGDSNLDELPENFGNLTELKNCFIWGNNLTELPESFGELESLHYLSMYDNQLTTLPDNFGDLDNLSKLFVEQNQLVTLPESFGDLQSLDTAYMYDNQLTSLPEDMSGLVDLRMLDLFNNQLTELPASFTELATIEELYLNYNQLEALPEEFGNLNTLLSLGLSNNSLTTLPGSIADLDLLEALFVLYNQIETLPDEIGNMSNLKFLGLDDNNLTGLPESIGNLSKLGYIGLSDNELASLPSSFGNLEADTVLLYSNNIPELPSTMFDNSYQYLWVENNMLQFGSIEPLLGQAGNFSYVPQGKIGEEQTMEIVNGWPLVIDIPVSGENNVYSWYKDGFLLTDQTSSTLNVEFASYDDQGTYHLEVTNSLVTDLILESYEVEVTIITSIDESESHYEAKIYPNPVHGDNVFVQVGNSENVSAFEIINSAGAIMYARENAQASNAVNIGSFETGLYLVKISYRDGKQLVEKLMIR